MAETHAPSIPVDPFAGPGAFLRTYFMTRQDSKSVRRRIAQAMLVDQFSLQKGWRSLQGKDGDQRLADARARFQDRLDRSCELRLQRRNRMPPIDFDDTLPIAERRDEIIKAIRNHQVVVVCGETGSGKSTQLPKICLAMGRGEGGYIGHTQPRRIAARTIANRLTEELQGANADAVGYKIRFTDRTKPTTYVKLMTDGILLAETQADRFLEQ